MNKDGGQSSDYKFSPRARVDLSAPKADKELDIIVAVYIHKPEELKAALLTWRDKAVQKALKDKITNEYLHKWDGSTPKSNVGDTNE